MTNKIRYHVLATLLGASLGASLGCGDKEEGGGGAVSTAEIKSGCEAYCAKARLCDEAIDLTTCTSDCRSRLADCMSDEQARAVDDLENCGTEACNEFNRCAIGAGLQCTFGI